MTCVFFKLSFINISILIKKLAYFSKTSGIYAIIIIVKYPSPLIALKP